MSYYIDAQAITDATLLYSSLAEDPTPAWASSSLAEGPTPAWASGGTYAVNAEVHRVGTHRVYRDSAGGVSTVPPESDPTRWKNMRPTNKWAAWDEYGNTVSASTSADIVFTFTARFCNTLHLRGLDGAGITVSIKDAVGGTVAYRYPGPVGSTAVGRLIKPASGYWDYAFGRRRRRKVLSLFDLPIFPAAEITVTISAASGQRRAVGMILVGKLRNLIGAGWGGTEQDATATPKTYTKRIPSGLDDGTYTLAVRGSSKDLQMTLAMDREYADACVDQLEELMSRPVCLIATREPGFDGLSGVGFITRSPVRYRNREAYCDISQEGTA